MIGGEMVLQLCQTGMDFADYLGEFMFVQAGVCYQVSRVGLATLGMISYAAVAIPIYLTTGSIMIPLVLLLLTGGATVSQMAAPGVSLAAIVLLNAGAGAITYLYYKFG